MPLYSSNNLRTKKVFPSSGLNQWNAKGRKRDNDEVYIPFPVEVRAMYENFFPNRETPFDVELPDGTYIKMKVCQGGGKALMSNPNKTLGKWILRDILRISPGELVTYDMLLELGIDSVSFEKVDNKYKLNFQKIGEYEKFLYNFVISDI